MIEPTKLYDQEAVAEFLGISPRTLEKARLTGGFVPYCKIGRLVRYRGADVLAAVEAGRRQSTSEQGS